MWENCDADADADNSQIQSLKSFSICNFDVDISACLTTVLSCLGTDGTLWNQPLAEGQLVFHTFPLGLSFFA